MITPVFGSRFKFFFCEYKLWFLFSVSVSEKVHYVSISGFGLIRVQIPAQCENAAERLCSKEHTFTLKIQNFE